MAVNSPPPSFQLPHHILWPSCHLGPMVEGAMTPTSPELGTAAVGKLVQGGKSLRCTLQVSLCLHKSSTCSGYLCLIPPIRLIHFHFYSPLLPLSLFLCLLTIAHPPPEFLSTEIWTAPLSALLPLGPPKRRRKNCQIACQSFILKPQHVPSPGLVHKPGSL